MATSLMWYVMKVTAAWNCWNVCDMQNTQYFLSHTSLSKHQATAVQESLRLSAVAHGIVSHPMECYDTASFILHCCIVGRCFAAPVGGSRVMDAEKLRGCRNAEATIWAFWDRVTEHLRVRWQEQKGRVERGCDGFALKGERGRRERSAAGFPHVSSLPFTIKDATAAGLYSSCIPKQCWNL